MSREALPASEIIAWETEVAVEETSRKTHVSTREFLLVTAESLFLSQGVNRVSLREIARAAGQRNPSALQYHFGDREGLIEAIVARRMQQQETRRAELLHAVLLENEILNLRDMCSITLGGPYLLCREDTSYRDVLGVFGLQWFAAVPDYFSVEFGQESHTMAELWRLGYQLLDHLPTDLLALRMENAYGAGLLALSRRARDKGSFRGKRAELFFNNLVDQVTAMLDCSLSDETGAVV